MSNAPGRPAVTVVNGKKPCSRCKKVLPVRCFSRMSSAASGYHSACKDCTRNTRTGNQTTGRRTARDSVLWTKYGIREADYLRMYREQHGRCAICNIKEKSLCIDHDHATNRVRGLLCKECNFGLGKFKDNLGLLRAAVSYLERTS